MCSSDLAWAWFTGWFNLLGQVAVTASIDFGLATFIGFFLTLTVAPDFAGSPWQILIIYAVVLAVHGLLNTFGVRLVARLNDISAWWHVLGTLVIVGALFLVPDSHRPLSEVFGTQTNATGLTGSPARASGRCSSAWRCRPTRSPASTPPRT